MKNLAPAVFAIALILGPASVLADQNSFQAPSAQMRQAFQYMEQAHMKVDQLHAQARLATLSSLSLAHRTLLAQVVGQLAISSNPNLDAAARTIDASLSQAEGRAILNISQSLEAQSRQIMDAARQQMMAATPSGPQGSPEMGGPREHHMMMYQTHPQSTDPGTILLLMSLHGLEPFGPQHAIFMSTGRRS
jgi:hypothetical protein